MVSKFVSDLIDHALGRFLCWPFFLFQSGRQVIKLGSVHLRSGESQDSLLKRFRKKVVKSGVLSTIRNKRWFISKSETRRMEKKKAIRRMKRKSFKDVE
jgi:small subunit ribosomal protein S21